MSYNFANLEKITDQEFDQLKARFERNAGGSNNFNWENDNKTIISFYAYQLGSTMDESLKILDPTGEWDIRCHINTGHDTGTYGTIRKIVNLDDIQENIPKPAMHDVLDEAIETIRHEYENQNLPGDSGDITIVISDRDRPFQRRYDLSYSTLSGKLVVVDKSHPQSNS